MKPTDAKGLGGVNVPVKPTGDTKTDTFQRSTKTAVETIKNVPLMQGQTLTITVGTEFKEFAHGLGRPWQGWHVIDTQGAMGVVSDGKPHARTLKLKAATAGACKIWVH